MGRPLQAQANSTLNIFKLNAEGSEALRVKAKLGRASVSTIEVLDGLKPGDQVILSDTSQYDSNDHIRLK